MGSITKLGKDQTWPSAPSLATEAPFLHHISTFPLSSAPTHSTTDSGGPSHSTRGQAQPGVILHLCFWVLSQ